MADDSTLAGDIATAMTAASGDSPSPDPSTSETPAVSASADPTRPPAADGSPAKAEPSTQQGVPPEHRWPSILDNARKEAAAAKEAEWQQYAWAKQVDRAALEESVRIAQRWKGDKVAFLQELLQEANQDPAARQQLLSMQARALAAARGSRQTDGFDLPEPDVAITDATGQHVGGTYSAERLKQILSGAVQQAVQLAVQQTEQRFAPMAKTVGDYQQAQQQAREAYEVDHYATTTFDDMKSWPGMDSVDNQKAVGLALQAMPVDGDDPRAVTLALNAAYRQVVLPKLQVLDRQSVLNDIHQKAGVNTVSPTAPTAGTPKSYADMGWKEAFEHEIAARR